MSDILLCVISLDRYIYVVHKSYYKTIVTKWSLTITIVWTILSSATWAIFQVIFRTRLEIAKIAKLYFAMSAYTRTIVAIAVVLYAALLRKVKQTTKNSSLPPTRNRFKFSKDNSNDFSYRGGDYFPVMISLSVFAYETLNFTDKRYIQKLRTDLLWTVLPCQINAIINSVIFLAKNGPMKRYYSMLFNCGIDTRNLK